MPKILGLWYDPVFNQGRLSDRFGFQKPKEGMEVAVQQLNSVLRPEQQYTIDLVEIPIPKLTKRSYESNHIDHMDTTIASVSSGDWAVNWMTYGFHNQWPTGNEIHIKDFLTSNNIINLINSGQYDEVWTGGVPIPAAFEGAMCAPDGDTGAFRCHDTLIYIPGLNRRFIWHMFEISNWNPLHNYFHRIEIIMAYIWSHLGRHAPVYGHGYEEQWSSPMSMMNVKNYWQLFTLTESSRPNEAQVGTCLAGETRVITRNGVKSIAELSGSSHELLTSDGRWITAPVKSFGKQQLFEITLERGKAKKVIRATREHRWLLRPYYAKGGGKGNRLEATTEELRIGDNLEYSFPSREIMIEPNRESVARGFVFGDGTLNGNRSPTARSLAIFCGEKDKIMLDYFSEYRSPRLHGPNMVISGLPHEWKAELPSLDSTTEELYGWLSGYFAADGDVTKDGQVTLSSAVKENLEYTRIAAQQIGVGTYGIRMRMRVGKSTRGPLPLYHVSWMRKDLDELFFVNPSHRERFSARKKVNNVLGWKVVSVRKTEDIEEVYCAVVDGTHAFALEDNILTSNCHFMPNSKLGYVTNMKDVVPSSHKLWYDYPDGFPIDLNRTDRYDHVSVATWGNLPDYIWQYAHIPKADGVFDGRYANWWKYIIDVNEEFGRGQSTSIPWTGQEQPLPVAINLVGNRVMVRWSNHDGDPNDAVYNVYVDNELQTTLPRRAPEHVKFSVDVRLGYSYTIELPGVWISKYEINVPTPDTVPAPPEIPMATLAEMNTAINNVHTNVESLRNCPKPTNVSESGLSFHLIWGTAGNAQIFIPRGATAPALESYYSMQYPAAAKAFCGQTPPPIPPPPIDNILTRAELDEAINRVHTNKYPNCPRPNVDDGGSTFILTWPASGESFTISKSNFPTVDAAASIYDPMYPAGAKAQCGQTPPPGPEPPPPVAQPIPTVVEWASVYLALQVAAIRGVPEDKIRIRERELWDECVASF